MMWRCGLLGVVLVVLLQVVPAGAAKEHFDVGEDVPVFTLKAVNPDVAGSPYVSIDHFFGPEAKTPKKAVLLSFFATYCEPCKKELPYLASLQEAYGALGLQTMLVSIDKEADKIKEAGVLANAAGATFPVLSDRFNIVAKRYMISKLPCVYIINGDGKVHMVNVGYSDDISKHLFDELRRALGISPDEPVPTALASYLGTAAGVEKTAVEDGKVDGAAKKKDKRKKRRKRRKRNKKSGD